MTRRIEIKVGQNDFQWVKSTDKKQAIKKATFLGKTITVGGKKLDKNSVINFLNQNYLQKHTDQPTLKEGWLLGFFGESDQTVRDVFQQFINEQLGEIATEPISTKNSSYAKDWSFFSSTPTVDLNKTEIFAFAEDHRVKAHRKYIGSVINQYYRPGDIILLEDVAKGEVVSKSDLTKYVKAGCLQQGWDYSQKSTYFEGNKAILEYEALSEAVNSFAVESRSNREGISPGEYIETHAEEFLKKIDRFYDFFIIDSKRDAAKKLALGMLKSASSMNIDETEGEGIAEYFIHGAINTSQFREKAEQLKYKYLSPQAAKKISLEYSQRNESLQQAIDENYRPGRRIFIIAGGLHLFQSASQDFQSTVDVKRTLTKHPYVIACPKALEKHKKLRIRELNRDYVKIPNPFTSSI